MQKPLSQFEVAWRDTLIHKAEGFALDRLAKLFSVPRSETFSLGAWRKALLAAGFGRRGTRGLVQAFLEAILTDVTPAAFGCTLSPASPHVLTAVVGAPFTAEHAGRLVLIGSAGNVWTRRLVYSTGPAFLDGVPKNYLELAPYDSGYWASSDWDVLLSGGAVSTTAVVLPFVWREPVQQPLPGADAGVTTWGSSYDGDRCVVEIDVDKTISSTPPTYMQPAGAAPFAAFEPNGGIIDKDVDSADATQGADKSSPTPLYITGTSVDSVEQALDPLLAAGIWARAMVEDFSSP